MARQHPSDWAALCNSTALGRFGTFHQRSLTALGHRGGQVLLLAVLHVEVGLQDGNSLLVDVLVGVVLRRAEGGRREARRVGALSTPGTYACAAPDPSIPQLLQPWPSSAQIQSARHPRPTCRSSILSSPSASSTSCAKGLVALAPPSSFSASPTCGGRAEGHGHGHQRADQPEKRGKGRASACGSSGGSACKMVQMTLQAGQTQCAAVRWAALLARAQLPEASAAPELLRRPLSPP